MNDVYEYEVKNQATEETHDLTWKTPPMWRGKTTGTSQQQSHYLKSFGLHAYGGLRSGPSLRRRASAPLRQKPDLYAGVNLEQLQHYLYSRILCCCKYIDTSIECGYFMLLQVYIHRVYIFTEAIPIIQQHKPMIFLSFLCTPTVHMFTSWSDSLCYKRWSWIYFLYLKKHPNLAGL